MAKQDVCDICKKPTDAIVGKLSYTPINRGSSANGFHNKYTHHLDVGVCCNNRLMKSFRWRERLTAAAYRARGRRAS